MPTDDPIDASDQIRPEHIRRFKRIARSMAKLLVEIREYCPEANLYLEDSGNWHLLTGDSHECRPGLPEKMRQDRSAALELVMFSGGGAW